jgi:NTP pyrophosphatase (non-canonical NTP hydrolase)
MAMSLNEYQELAARTINKKLEPREVRDHALHLIAAECGEIHSVYQKLYQGHPFKLDDLMKEAGDLLWGIAELCTYYGVTLEWVANMNIEKLKARYPDGFDAEKSLHGQEGDV